MISLTKLKNLLWNNKVQLTIYDGEIEAIVTDKISGDSHLVSGKNWSEVLNKAISETRILTGRKQPNYFSEFKEWSDKT